MTNLKLEVGVFQKMGSSPFGLSMDLQQNYCHLPPNKNIQGMACHETKLGISGIDETLKYWEQPPKKGRTKIKRWQNSIWQNMNQWANVSLKYSSCFQSRLQEATTIIEIWFGYVWLFHNETSKDLLHAQQHLKTWVLLQKGVALPSENESNKQVRCVVYRWPC